MIICAPLPRMSRALRRKARASSGSKLPSVEPGKILAQGASLRVEEVAGNVDRDIGAEIAALQQQADLGGGAGAEFHQRGPLGNNGSDLVAAAAQNAELGAGRIIFRQDRDLLEQFRACGIVEIFR